jgi:prepilin-type N-terminal cleavage/methylation domain-containing protein
MKSKGGFTLIELVTALAILLILLAAVYQVYSYVSLNFGKSEELWAAQQEVHTAAALIEEGAGKAFRVEIYADSEYSGGMTFAPEDMFFYIFQGSDGLIYLREPGGDAVKVTENRAELSFYFSEDSSNVLKYRIEGRNRENTQSVYEVESAVFLKNLINSSEENTNAESGAEAEGHATAAYANILRFRRDMEVVIIAI